MTARSRRPSGAAVLPPFEHVLDQYGVALLRFLAAQVGPDRADDCFQETMLAALRAYDEVRDPGSIRAWLFAIASRKAVDAHRDRGRAPQAVEDVETLGAASRDVATDAALWARVRDLPDKQRHAVLLRYRADLSHREIALVMETSEAAARRNVFEGVQSLRTTLRVGEARSSGEPNTRRASHERSRRSVSRT